MSHFTVLVPAANEDELLERLTPYYEYGCSREMDELVQPFLEFHVEHRAADFRKDALAILKEAKGEEWEADYRALCEAGDYEAVFERWDGGERHPATGDWGWWRNPNAKWDWYSVGGRWADLLLLNPGASGESGTPRMMTPPNRDPSRADAALAGDVDWQGMALLAADRAAGRGEVREAVRARLEAGEIDKGKAKDELREAGIWDLYRDDDETSSPRLRRLYYALYRLPGKSRVRKVAGGRVAALYAQALRWAFRKWPRRRLSPKEVFKAVAAQALTFAFVDLEGRWHQRGQMGWWGIVTDRRDGYDREFWDFVGSLPPGQKVYVVDCHI